MTTKSPFDIAVAKAPFAPLIRFAVAAAIALKKKFAERTGSSNGANTLSGDLGHAL